VPQLPSVLALAGVLLLNAGCLGGLVRPGPEAENERIMKLVVESEGSGQIQAEESSLWKRLWSSEKDQPMTYDRIHGGLQ
jgi:hypothetical protein